MATPVSQYSAPHISMQYSAAGLALTKSFEGLSRSSYKDCAGVLTIGYGHTGPDVYEGQLANEAQAEAWLLSDMHDAVHCVNGAVKVSLTQSQFDALVDFCFNAGRGAFLGSTLLRYVNANNFSAATAQFGLWVHAGGAVEPGLVRRRAEEAKLFSGVTA